MVCTWFHEETKQCCNAYCHYSRNNEISCPIKKEYIAEVGDFHKESLESKPLINQAQTYRKFPKQY
jgi:hypothetical protein